MANFDMQFIDGVLSAEPDVVCDALAGGADPNVSCVQAEGVPYTHALQEILAAQAKAFMPGADADKKLRLTLIAREILEMGPQLREESGFLGTSTLDEIICPAETRQRFDAGWVDLAASAVITTLAQDTDMFRETYRINFDAIFAGLGEPRGGDEEKHLALRHEAMETIKAVHARVCERLNDPATIREHRLSEKISEVGFWLQPLEAPDTAILPRPSPRLNECSKKFEAAANALQMCVSAEYTPQKEEKVQAFLETAQYAQREIRHAADEMRTLLKLRRMESFVDSFANAQAARQEVEASSTQDASRALAKQKIRFNN